MIDHLMERISKTLTKESPRTEENPYTLIEITVKHYRTKLTK